MEKDTEKNVSELPHIDVFGDEKKEGSVWLRGIVALIILLAFLGLGSMSNSGNAVSQSASLKNASSTGYAVYDEVVAKVFSEKGFQSKIMLGNSIVKLVEHGVIARDKFEAIYKNRGGLPDEFKGVFTEPSNKPMLLTQSSANMYVNLLWPLGLANFMESNKESPIDVIPRGATTSQLYNFASTAGWGLGKEKNGGAYFNKLAIVELTPEQEALVMRVAKNTYRPCCNNSTFFQDCNHGSALLGLLELGAAEGLTEGELYREALAFNSYWFPQNYIPIALYFKVVKKIDWENIDPKVALGKEYSSASGYSLVQAKIDKIPNLIPEKAVGGGGSCGT